MSIFTSFNFKWPPSLVRLFDITSAAIYNDQLMAPECSVSAWSFQLKWYMVQLIPLIFVLVFFVLLGARGVWVR